MKRTVLILAALLLIGGSLLFFGTEWYVRSTMQTVALKAIPTGTVAEAADVPDPTLAISFAYEDTPLSVNGDGSILLPVLPESGIAVSCERNAEITKTETVQDKNGISYRSVAITVRKNGRSRTVTLLETHIAVAYLDPDIKDLNESSEPILNKNRICTLTLFSIDENGNLRYESGRVSAKRRGASSLDYKKKSYTLTNLDSTSNPVVRSLMGFPADEKFALNSMYEDDVKIRDILSLGIWQSMQPAGSPAIQMRYCELYIGGVYWGLYGFQQIVTAKVFNLQPEDGLLKVASDCTEVVLKNHKVYAVDVVQSSPDRNIGYDFLDALACLAEKQPDALSRFDIGSLYRYALFIQLIAGGDSVTKNIVASFHADTGRFSLCAYDTDQSFGLVWDNGCDPLYMGVHPKMASRNLLKGDYSPWSGLLSLGDAVTKPLAELWFSLRKDTLSEETLLTAARQAFTLITDSGAREREHTRWPDGNYTDTCAQVETFLTERLPWCDTFFEAYLGGN